ncbi:hypothetical protein ECG_09454 [Echinococcus granulosus]|nr:hypothetical protein ECG_09454 [Echinococcus granulosus]
MKSTHFLTAALAVLLAVNANATPTGHREVANGPPHMSSKIGLMLQLGGGEDDGRTHEYDDTGGRHACVEDFKNDGHEHEIDHEEKSSSLSVSEFRFVEVVNNFILTVAGTCSPSSHTSASGILHNSAKASSATTNSQNLLMISGGISDLEHCHQDDGDDVVIFIFNFIKILVVFNTILVLSIVPVVFFMLLLITILDVTIFLVFDINTLISVMLLVFPIFIVFAYFETIEVIEKRDQNVLNAVVSSTDDNAHDGEAAHCDDWQNEGGMGILMSTEVEGEGDVDHGEGLGDV